MRGVPAPGLLPSRRRHDSCEADGAGTATGAASGRYGGYRTRPVTGATGRGSSARCILRYVRAGVPLRVSQCAGGG